MANNHSLISYMRRSWWGTSARGIWLGRILYYGAIAASIYSGSYLWIVVIVGSVFIVKSMWYLEVEKDIPFSDRGRDRYQAKHSGTCPTCGQDVPKDA